ncbi:hypothetical protein [Saccharothrix longispora]|uniref:hypothetical protein n=1 Tax=Saccharothrix longispora TaxID=33920 RepID=UPI0028FD833C|nr:hypothetical protein [Saccharothrix longispora]MBY8849033.1 hypothetical protein [Saccharothrix sp. MB29]MDU0290538.1 hypothetical protein [Saccharothrix longispora]
MSRGAVAVVAVVLLLAGCGAPVAGGPLPTLASLPDPTTGASPASAPVTTTAAPTTTTAEPEPATAGNPAGNAVVPPEAAAVDTAGPTRVIGTGTPASCTSDAVVAAVAAGGVITFDCGPDPVTIDMTATAKVRNDTGPRTVLDGGGLVTLSGSGRHRIVYQNTCDRAQGITTSHCQDQDHPHLVIQNITLADGDSTGDSTGGDTGGGGGGAVFVRGGRVKVVNTTFRDNRCDPAGPDLGGAGMRVLSQFRGAPVHVVSSTFEGGKCANGGALSGIGVSWVVLNSVLRGNSAIGHGANPAREGTPGGGSGGAIYGDGNEFTVRIAGSVVEDNEAAEGGGAVFFVSNDRTGTLRVEGSVLRRNPSAGFETPGYKGIFFLGAATPSVSGSTIQ